MKRPPPRFIHPIRLGTHAAIPRVNLTYSNMTHHSSLSRRKFLSVSTKTSALGLLASGLPTGWLGAQTTSDTPEIANINFGIIALLICLGGWATISGHSKTTTYVDDWGDKATKTERFGLSKNLPSPAET